MGLVAVTFLVNAPHGLGGDRKSWRILVSVSASTVQKGSLFENRRKGATPVMDMALWGGQKPESQKSGPKSPGYRAHRNPIRSLTLSGSKTLP